MARESDFITLARAATRDLLDTLARVSALKREYDARGGAAWLGASHFVGENAGITEAQFETGFGNLAAINDYVAAQNYDDTWFPLL